MDSPPQVLHREHNCSCSALTRKLDIHKDFDECLGQVARVLVRAEHSLAMKHTRDEWVLSLVQVRHHSFQHFSQLGSQVRILHSARERTKQIQDGMARVQTGAVQELHSFMPECLIAADHL